VTATAEELLSSLRARFGGEGHENRFVALATAGRAPLSSVAALGAEEMLIVPSDRRSFLGLAARTEEPNAAAFFTGLAAGEALALAHLPALIAAAGMDAAAHAAYEPRPGCQAYPAYLAALSRDGEPAAVILAMLVNFAAWGSYCAALGEALRRGYGFDDAACGFFDFFATPVPEMETQALAAVQAAVDAGSALADAGRYVRLLQSYEMSFWNTLADQAGSAG
jgi:TENA/THI-4/PQQC family protein